MAKARAAADRPVATSQELRRAALARSSRRNAWVAWRRLWWRWMLWSVSLVLRWLTLPALLAVGLAWWFDWSPLAASPRVPAVAAMPPKPRPAPMPASAPPAAPSSPASAPTADAPNAAQPSPLQLRLDAEPDLRRRYPQAQFKRPARLSTAPSEESK